MSATLKAVPSGCSGSITNPSYAYHDSDYSGSNYASVTAAYGQTSVGYLTFDFSALPDDATILRVDAYVSVAKSSRTGSAGVGLYAGTVEKNAITTFSDAGKTKIRFTDAGWTAAELKQARLAVQARSTGVYVQITAMVYGADVTVEYETGGAADVLYVKENGAWTAAGKAYKKVGGAWAEQSDLTQLFDANKSWVRG